MEFPPFDTFFSLQPFFSNLAPAITITVRIRRSHQVLDVRFSVSGAFDSLALPPPATHPCRHNNLWQETCFELFFGPHDSPAYQEINLSPALHWNCYRFSQYRQGMHEELAIATLHSRAQQQPDALSWDLSVDLAGLGYAHQTLDIGLASVILDQSGAISHWALTHSSLIPDFHNRKDYALLLPVEKQTRVINGSADTSSPQPLAGS